jgi:hypothetical protein
VFRVDDLVPTAEVIKTSKPWSQPEYQLMLEWKDAATPADRPQVMIDREVVANARWQARNDELIAERIVRLQDPAITPGEAAKLQGEIHALQVQNHRLGAGAVQFSLELKTPPPAADANGPSAAGPAGVGSEKA